MGNLSWWQDMDFGKILLVVCFFTELAENSMLKLLVASNTAMADLKIVFLFSTKHLNFLRILIKSILFYGLCLMHTFCSARNFCGAPSSAPSSVLNFAGWTMESKIKVLMCKMHGQVVFPNINCLKLVLTLISKSILIINTTIIIFLMPMFKLNSLPTYLEFKWLKLL